MARVKAAVHAHKKRRKILKLAKGYFGAKSRQFRIAKQAVMKSGVYAYRDRRARKRNMRQLWINRINAAALIKGLSYSKFMGGLKKHNIEINRKMLAEMAVNDKEAFAQLVEIAKKA